MRNVFLSLVVGAVICSSGVGFAQPGGPPGNSGNPDFGSVSASLSYAAPTLSGSATFNAMVPAGETEDYVFDSFWSCGPMNVSGQHETLAPGQSATWTLSNSMNNPSSGLKELHATLANTPEISYYPPTVEDPDPQNFWILVDDASATTTVP